MLLRKHLGNAKILDITQPGLERIVNMKLEHMDELGDLKIKYLIIELMENTVISFSATKLWSS